jgi:glutaminyl-peptide cyclotransferase
MITDYLKYIILLTIIMLITWTLSCSGRSGGSQGGNTSDYAKNSDESEEKLIKIISPEENNEFKLKDQIKVVLASVQKNIIPDSVKLWFDGKTVAVLKSERWEYNIPSSFSEMTGRKALKAVAYKNGKKPQTVTRFLILFSDVVPKKYGYKVVSTYPHDRLAFTQGLVYDDGILYEGTGTDTGSSLRKVELETGRVIMQQNLEPPLFGEGIATMGNRIFQLTWTSKVGFVYDKNNFKLINKVYYQTQGWGLTTIGDKLLLSDGTNVLYYIEPELFTTISKIEVYDNEHKVDNLNELELINGEIWANIWGKDLIARIDPASGKVLAYIDLTGLKPKLDGEPEPEVLNGIAWDPQGQRIFVTGKWWPKLFEIKPTE